MTVGIDTRAVYEDGTVFTPDVLGIDIDEIRGQFTTAGSSAMNLAMHIAYTTSQTIRPLLALAHSKAIALSVNSAYPTPETVKQLLAKARADMHALASRVPDALDDELRGNLSAAPAPQAPAKAEDKGDEEDAETEKAEEEEADEEEAGAGLGALFG
jgi:large subunit ribosomal protein L10